MSNPGQTGTAGREGPEPPPLRAASGITWKAVGNEIVLLDLKAGRYYGLNPTAAFIWQCRVEPAPGRTGPADYAAAFGVAPDVAAKDFETVTRDLLARGFLEPGTAPPT